MIIPVDDCGVDYVKKLKPGEIIKVTPVKPRNLKFHRKFFSMINFAFDYWQPPQAEWKGIAAVKSIEVFREQVTILAGYRDVTFNLDGSVKVKAKSISFAKMTEEEFESLYKAVFNVLWTHVMSKVENFTEQELEHCLLQLLAYD